ncbi:bifunctional diguanylate cyclase/phosphodiesterase [Novosphingobium profundi]|uniref:bifunctional diguanylate cyclase/phosphodiesterase n=1 Tax=Novosphingobium profundi TaxID=1774954 RepID=UPI001FE50704|nr:EAL domain-containing protein [Novosphingobium profundi]
MQHRVDLLLLAVLVCTMACATTVLLLRQAQSASTEDMRRWRMLAGAALGFGAWATHFIALLGYVSGMPQAYALLPTLASLAIGAVVCALALLPAHPTAPIPVRVGSAAILTAGLGSMHYVGMLAIQVPARFQWDSGFVAASLVLPLGLMVTGLLYAQAQTGRRGVWVATALFVFGIAILHILGMSALSLIPDRTPHAQAVIRPEALASWIATVALALFATGIATQFLRDQARTAVLRSESLFSDLVKSVSDYAILMLDPNGLISQWNEGAKNLTGYTSEDILGMPVARLFSYGDRCDDLPARTLDHAREAGRATGECLYARRDGSTFWGHGTIQANRTNDGSLIGYSFIMRDISRFKADKDLIAQTTMRLDTALTNMHEGLCLFDAQEHLVLCNERFRELWSLAGKDCEAGTTLAEMVRAGFMNLDGEEHAEPALAQYRQLLKETFNAPNTPAIVIEFDNAKAVSIANRALPDGGWVTTCDDVTEQRRSEARIQHMALHDNLTGLPNRARFNQRLQDKLGLADRTGSKVAVIAVDLDRFKEVNDTQGHAAGDALLQAIGLRITERIKAREIVARLGGDEFAAAKVFTEDGELSEFVGRLHECISGAGIEPGCVVEASVGIAIYPHDGIDREGLVNNADLAMYRAKNMRGEKTCFYEEGMDEAARRRRQLANDLRHAMERGELHLLYQPQRSLRTGNLSGYEALLRWQHPRLGAVPPDVFIPIAEESGAIFEIGEWVLRDACQEATRWKGHEKIAVNLSPVQFVKPDLVASIRQILADTGLSPSRLELEITETAIISDKLRALHCLRQLKAMGISVAIDDFGTGYSSLDTLHSFPFDKIKIDKSFLLRSETSSQARAIIRAVLALGKSLEIPVLAEGVETEAQLAVLESEGCDEAQGYFFGRPDTPPSQPRKAAVNS